MSSSEPPLKKVKHALIPLETEGFSLEYLGPDIIIESEYAFWVGGDEKEAFDGGEEEVEEEVEKASGGGTSGRTRGDPVTEVEGESPEGGRWKDEPTEEELVEEDAEEEWAEEGRKVGFEWASGVRTWRTCGVGGCVYRTKKGASRIKLHKAAIHSIDIVWHNCPELGCEYKAKMKSTLKEHIALVHDIGVTWHACPEPNCSHKAKSEGNIKKHRAFVHGIGVTWHACTELGCEYKAKSKRALKGHRAAMHDIDVLWWLCDFEGCEHRAKSSRLITQHKANKHNIDVKWEQCPHCEYKAKQTCQLNAHIKRQHPSE